MTSAPRTSRSFLEHARRAQLVEVTIALVAEHGYAAASLSKIAQAAHITKGAVLYHFETKDAVIAAAHESVLAALVATVSRAVAAAPIRDRPAAYVRAMIGHFRDHPDHVRMLTESLTTVAERPSSRLRWAPLEELILAAREGAEPHPPLDTRSLAIAMGGAIDAIVTEKLTDPGYDTESATQILVLLLNSALQPSRPQDAGA